MFKPIVQHIVATSIEDGWFQATTKVVEEGRRYKIEYGNEYRLSHKVIVEMHTPGARPLAPLMPEGSGLTPPTTDEKIHTYFEMLISPNKEKNQHYSYGQDLWWQVEEVLKYFKKYGHDTACCHMPIGRPESFFSYSRDVDYDECIIVKDRNTGEILWTKHLTNSWSKNPDDEVSTQCLRGIDVWIENGKLYFWCYFRSNDLWNAFPENYGGIQLVKEYMCEVLQIEDGSLIGSSKDLHIYEYAWLDALMRLKKDPAYLARLKTR